MKYQTEHHYLRTAPAMGLRFCAGVLCLFLAWFPMQANAIPTPDAATGSSWFVDMNRFAQSAHAGFKCEACHGTMLEHGRKHPDVQSPDFLKKPATRTYDYSRCGKCHQVSFDRAMRGGHARALAAELEKTDVETGSENRRPAPTCGDCHRSHYDRSKLSRVAIGKQMTVTCGKCHPEHTASYLDNIHGKLGVDLENAASAFCTDCHGAHNVNSLSKKEEALAACIRCHPKADIRFADVVIHASADSPTRTDDGKNQSILWISRVRTAAVAAVALSLVFFLGHSFLWLLREFHEKLRKH